MPVTRRALVTGGAGGIGAAIARRLADDGHEVVVGDISGGEGVVFLDVTDLASVQAAVEESGPFDILVNNAGVDHFGYFTKTTPDDWRRVLGVNLDGVLNCTYAVLPGMQSSGWGRIVTISSEAARVGATCHAVYAASKGALLAFTKCIARENARYGVTANAIAPGPIETPLVEQLRREQGDRAIDPLIASTLLRRLGRPEEIAAAVSFLASDDAAYITAETLGVSGGIRASA